MNEFLRASNLKKWFHEPGRKVEVIKGIDLRLKQRKFMALLGPSGAGKSTLIHLLGGLDRPSSGRVFLDGLDLYGMPDNELAGIRNRKIGFVFQFYHLLREFTALENVMLPALIGRRKQGAEKRARDLLAEVGLEDRLSHRPGELSGGEQQRVAIARALMMKPEMLFCDEPAGCLDSERTRDIMDLLKNLNRRDNVTIFMVTHQEDLTEWADEVFRIKDGLLQ